MLSSGANQSEVARAFGVTRQAVSWLINKYGLSVNVAAQVAIKEEKRANLVAKKRDPICFKRYGCSYKQWQEIPKSAKTAYRTQKSNAGSRGIEWGFNLYEWWSIWRDSGKFAERGTGRGYVMGRIEDAGPYKPGNVYICTQVQNMQDSYIFKPASQRRKKCLQVAAVAA